MSQALVIAGGYLNINKDRGWTSTDVVRKLKGVTRSKKLGHGGTLDPIATGVLPICIGPATRFAETVLLGTKSYRVNMVLGSSTDTYDSTGEITAAVKSFEVTRPQIIEILEGFKGDFLQTPPMYSALHHKGKRLYEFARAGIEVERPPRSVKVLSLKLVEFEGAELVLDVECSHGFYARTLAHDIGEKLGTHAHMSGLTRTHAGPFKLEDTVSIEDVIEIADSGDWRDLLMPIDTTLQHYGSVNLDTSLVEMVRHGRSLPISTFGEDGAHMPGERIRAYTPTGDLLAILIFEPDRLRWRPEKVLAGL